MAVAQDYHMDFSRLAPEASYRGYSGKDMSKGKAMPFGAAPLESFRPRIAFAGPLGTRRYPTVCACSYLVLLGPSSIANHI